MASRLISAAVAVAAAVSLIAAPAAQANPLSASAAATAIAKINGTACPTGAEYDKALAIAARNGVTSREAAVNVTRAKIAAEYGYLNLTPGDLERVANVAADRAVACNLIAGAAAPAANNSGTNNTGTNNSPANNAAAANTGTNAGTNNASGAAAAPGATTATGDAPSPAALAAGSNNVNLARALANIVPAEVLRVATSTDIAGKRLDFGEAFRLLLAGDWAGLARLFGLPVAR